MAKLTPKQLEKVKAIAEKNGYADFNYLSANKVRSERRMHFEAILALDEILAIIEPLKITSSRR